MNTTHKQIVIVGGGFGGVRAALDLAKKNMPDTTITLISDKPHFEYHALLYRVLTGRSPLEVCIPLQEIFKGKNVDVVEDFIIEIRPKEHIIKSSSGATYHYDTLILALGSEPSYFNTPGLKELSYSINTITSTLKLKRHLHDVFLKCEVDNTFEKTCSAHIIIVGGGPTGVETAGELAIYARTLAEKHGIDPSFVTLDLIQSGSRLMPTVSPSASEAIRRRLYSLGVNIFLNRRVMKEEIEGVFMKDMEVKSKTLIWCAGVIPNNLFKTVQEFSFDDKGRVVVDNHLRAKGFHNIYIVGDGASTQYSGMAQTALADGMYVAEDIYLRSRHLEHAAYTPKPPSYLIPIGHHWAVGFIGGITAIGFIGWIMRKAFDLKFLMSILPAQKAWLVYRSDATLWETCPICSKKD